MDMISRYIETMLENGSDGLLLMDGKPPVMRVQGKAQTISPTPITEADLAGFLTGPLAQPAASNVMR